MASGGAFVPEQMLAGNQWNRLAVDFRLSPHEQIPDFSFVQQLQEFFEVVGPPGPPGPATIRIPLNPDL